MRASTKGIALIAVIIIITITAIAVFGITAFVSNGLRLAGLRASSGPAVYAAQAGIYAALRDYLADPANPYWTKKDTTTPPGNAMVYTAGKNIDFLLVGATSAATYSTGGFYCLGNIALANINETDEVAVAKMKVEWTAAAAQLRRVTLFGAIIWEGAAATGIVIDRTSSPAAIDAKRYFAARDDNVCHFSANPGTVTVTFTMAGDNSSRKVYLNSASRRNTFSITSTGSAGAAKKTIEAVYDAGGGKIVSWWGR